MTLAALPAASDPRHRDPLAASLSRGRITRAQYQAGREFQKLMADPDDPTSIRWLAKCHRELGQDGSAIVHDALIRSLSPRRIAEARGMTGQLWERYFSRRLAECLTTLAEVLGFSRS